MMNGNHLKKINQTVERLHRCKASHVEDLEVIEKFGEKMRKYLERGCIHF